MINWFEFIFKRDVSESLLYEKIFKRFEEKKILIVEILEKH